MQVELGSAGRIVGMSNAAQMKADGLPKGELLGRYRTYEDAQKVVDHLAAAEDFDIKTLTIVGNDLRSVERIRAQLSYPRVAGSGAAQGAVFGFLIGLLVWLFAPEAPMINLLLSVMLGVLIWMLIAVISYAVRRGHRDFASSSKLVATTYDVVCDFAVAGRARQLVANSGTVSLNAWNDPTGQAANLGRAAPQGAQQPPGGDGSAPGPSHPKPGHEDLPDGRPRYGVRLEGTPAHDEPVDTQVPGAEEDDPGRPASVAPSASDQDATKQEAESGDPVPSREQR